MKKINTFKKACIKTGNDPKKQYPPFDTVEIIVKAIVGDWEADYSKWEQRKWYPIFIWDNKLGAFRFLGALSRLRARVPGLALFLKRKNKPPMQAQSLLKSTTNY